LISGAEGLAYGVLETAKSCTDNGRSWWLSSFLLVLSGKYVGVLCAEFQFQQSNFRIQKEAAPRDKSKLFVSAHNPGTAVRHRISISSDGISGMLSEPSAACFVARSWI
jgi:hypothetical protein